MGKMSTAFGMFLVVMMLVISTAQSAVISTGATSGNYYRVGVLLAAKMPGSTAITSKGSVENLDNLVSGKAQIAFVQADALAWYIAKHPEAQAKLEVMGPLYEECVFIAVNSDKKAKIKNEDDLQSTNGVIAVGPLGSGSAVTWDYMRQLEKGYAKAAVVNEGGIRALGKVAASPDGEINALLFTMRPDPNNKMFKSVVGNKNLRFIDVDDSDLNDKFPMTGKPIYKFRTEKVKGGFFDKEVTVPCVDAVVVASKDLEDETLEMLADIVLNYKTSIVRD